MRNCIFIFLFILFALAVDAQTVRNVKATQEGQKIAIAYELVCTQPTEINLFLSEDNGKTWSALKTGVSGDVGVEVTEGNKVIYWDVLQSKENLVWNAFVFKVKVKDQKKDENQINDIKSVKIGDQVWMAENLDADHYQNGDPIPEVRDGGQWSNLSSGAWCYYAKDIANGKIYGKLYNWYAVNDSRGLCPTGWHVPSDAEWTILFNFLGGSGVAGSKMRSKRLWSKSIFESTILNGFKALPSGYRGSKGVYSSIRDKSSFWSSTEYKFDASSAQEKTLSYLTSVVYSYTSDKCYGLSVRCIKD